MEYNWHTHCPVHGARWEMGPRGHWHAIEQTGLCERTPTLTPLLRDRLRNAAWNLGWNKKDLNEWLKAERGGTFSALNTDAKIAAAAALEMVGKPAPVGS